MNLPAHDKMIKPRYQEIPAQQIPTAQSFDGLVSVKVIAGEALGASVVIETRTPIMYLHFTLQPSAMSAATRNGRAIREAVAIAVQGVPKE